LIKLFQKFAEFEAEPHFNAKASAFATALQNDEAPLRHFGQSQYFPNVGKYCALPPPSADGATIGNVKKLRAVFVCILNAKQNILLGMFWKIFASRKSVSYQAPHPSAFGCHLPPPGKACFVCANIAFCLCAYCHLIGFIDTLSVN
jgi:hypothetical protein